MKPLLSLMASNITCGYSGEFPSTDHISGPILFNSRSNGLRTSRKSGFHRGMRNAVGGRRKEYVLTLPIIVDMTQYNSIELQPTSVGSREIFGRYTAQHKTKTRPENGGILGERER